MIEIIISEETIVIICICILFFIGLCILLYHLGRYWQKCIYRKEHKEKEEWRKIDSSNVMNEINKLRISCRSGGYMQALDDVDKTILRVIKASHIGKCK